MIRFVSMSSRRRQRSNLRTGLFAVSMLGLGISAARTQVMTIDTKHIDSRYADIKRTHVELGSQPVLQRTKLELVRVMESEQGFAMRPLPKGSKGMILVANGEATPNGADYSKAVEHYGTAFQPADRVMITDVKIYPDKIVFELNGGPDPKHKFLRHISVGAGGVMVPLAQDDGQEPQGARVTLQFEKFVPEMTGTQVKELLAPLVDFKLKTPIQAFTDTLPEPLRQAILSHHVLVGMNQEMVVYALGKPESKSREREGQMPFEEWMYGQPPEDVQFVRFNGNRVIQVEECKVGQPPMIRNQDEMGDYWNTAPTQEANVHEVKLGDTSADSLNQENARTAPPSLRKQGETLPNQQNSPQLDKVQFPPGMDGSNKPSPPASSAPAGSGGGDDSGSGSGSGNGKGTDSGTPSPSQPPSQYVAAVM